MTNKSRSQLGYFLAEMMTGIKEILWPRFVLKNSAHICQRSKTWKKVFDVDWNQCMTRPRQHRTKTKQQKQTNFKKLKTFLSMTTFAFSIQNRGSRRPRTDRRVELCIGKFVQWRKQLGKFVHGESFFSRKDASKSTSRKIFFLSFTPSFQLFCFGNWRMLLLLLMLQSTTTRRART